MLALVRPVGAVQQSAPLLDTRDIALGSAILGLGMAPIVLDLEPGPPSCLPCDPASVPFFDRFAITLPRDGLSAASDVALLSIAGATWWGLARGNQGTLHLKTSLEATALAAMATELLKVTIERSRPVLYTEVASGLDDPAAHRKSLPSGHTSVAFALATSFVLSDLRQGGSPLRRAVALGGAALVGALRVAAARHFPSDVLFGAAVGASSALLVHTIRF